MARVEPEGPPPYVPIYASDAERLAEEAGAGEYLIEPWLPRSTIVQVFGFSGHGKSVFVQHAMGALAAGRKSVGPFDVHREARVLYLDWEMGKATIARRLMQIRAMHGDPGRNLAVWTPLLRGDDMNLLTTAGVVELGAWIEATNPDVIVIDTVRSGFAGMQENNADAWSRVNLIATRLRNTGRSVIIVHHSNKPGELGIGREAGSSN